MNAVLFNGAEGSEKTLALRQRVFAAEQGYPEEKIIDKYENTADYLVLSAEDRAVGCCRFYKEAASVYHIDNIALDSSLRGTGKGRELIAELTELCRGRGAEKITVNAKSEAMGFYEKCGFAVCGLEYADETFKRIPMEMTFEFENCRYLKSEDGTEAYYVRKSFVCKNSAKAILRVTALGFFEPYFNGEMLTEEKFLPSLSNYRRRDYSVAEYPIYDTLRNSLYYLEFDVTDKIRDGKNTLCLHVGNGWYGLDGHSMEKLPKWGETSVIFKIILTDKNGKITEINSDTTAKWRKSYVLKTNIYAGETADGRLFEENIADVDYDDGDWKFTDAASDFPTVKRLQTFRGDTFDGIILPMLIKSEGDTKLYDLCEDTSGLAVVEFTEKAKEGDAVSVITAEALDENLNFLFRHTGGNQRIQNDTFICGKNKKEFASVFTWHAGRYIEVKGNGELTGFKRLYSPVKKTAEFKTENKTLQWYFDAYCRTQSCNIHSMIPSDCPHRERLGYTGDGQLCSAAAMTIFDSREMYLKWMEDIAECQDIFGGHIQHTAPFLGGGGGPGGWGGAIVITPFHFYEKFGDISILQKYYYPMQRYLDYMAAHCEDGIVVREEKGGWCLGDWCAPDNDVRILPEFVNTYFYIKCLEMVKRSAELLGKKADGEKYGKQIEAEKRSFTEKFFNPKTGSFLEGDQGADAFALDIGLGDGRTLANLTAKYERLGQFDTGIFGTDVLIRILFQKGRAGLAVKLLTNESENSFYNMKKHGSTALWENWDGCDSLCHPMFGACTEYLFTELLGIKQLDNSVGFEKIKIDPPYLPELGNISGSVETVRGKISVIVRYTDGVRSISYSADDKIKVFD